MGQRAERTGLGADVAGGPASGPGVRGGSSRFEAEDVEFSSGQVTFEAPGGALGAGRRRKGWGSEGGLPREKGLDSNTPLPPVSHGAGPLAQAVTLRFLTRKTGTPLTHRMGLL